MCDSIKSNDGEKDEERLLLDWTSKQGRILTANGQATNYYTAERGYPYKEDELPHYHLLANNNSTHAVFLSWAQKRQSIKSDNENENDDNSNNRKLFKNPVCGAWTRPLFDGGWEHSTSEDEDVFNVQTNTLFIDMRIPRVAKNILKHVVTKGIQQKSHVDGNDSMEILKSMTDDQLRLYARRHAFAGYTVLDYDNQHRAVCTRHHCVDWNFVGVPRPRPNKWFVEMHPDHSNAWKECAFAKDNFGQHYYKERWERLEKDAGGDGLVLALRKERNDSVGDDRDGILLVVGDHFNYIFARTMNGEEKDFGKSSLVELVDTALNAGDRKSAESYVSIDAGHGTISSGWVIDCAIQLWREGTSLFSCDSSNISVKGSSMESCTLSWKGSNWLVYESTMSSTQDLEFLLRWRAGMDDATQKSEALLNIIHGRSINSRKRKIDTDTK
mmetsp:Transcript_8378/g.10600  ORF Transcript_8378/g.10600 Transcript_8378/m.10600 type:complete len:442 (-) Transcript_8378:146-1471(-)